MQTGPDVGDHALDFTLQSTRGELRLSDLLRDSAVLLVFYPRDNTLVCTRQLCNYRDNLSIFEELDVQIVAINDDPLEAHQAFARKYDFPFPLASDPDRRVCHAYGALARVLDRTYLRPAADQRAAAEACHLSWDQYRRRLTEAIKVLSARLSGSLR